jgi:TPR repeat protein
MKITTSLVMLVGIIAFSNLQASGAVEQCKKLFDEAQYQQALAPCLESGKSGHLDSQSILGELYDRQSNSKETYFWWIRAANAGYIPARNQLALKFYYGGSVFGPEEGWRQDYSRAYSIWREDAQKGHPHAQFMVADMYFKGQGVRQDNVEAWIWFNLALDQGYKLAGDSLVELTRKMSTEQKQRAQEQIDTYRQRVEHYKKL